MAELSLTLFAAFQVLVDGGPVATFESDKVRALLAYLVVEAQPQRRTALAGLLWPDMPEGSARRNLSQVLFNLRQAIGDQAADPPYLLISRDSLQFNPASNHTVDVAHFTSLLAACDTHAHAHLDSCDACAARLQAAVDLYQGPFLHQFFLVDSAAFEEWAVLQREHLHRRALGALAHLANYHEVRGNYAQAMRVCERQLAFDPWREEAHQQLMRVLALHGQPSAALMQYETCRRVLAAELGVEPSTETKHLYEQIRRGEISGKGPRRLDDLVTDVAPQPSTALPLRNLPLQLTPFLGRERELLAIKQLLDNPDCRLLTLMGTGGIGKTRLAVEAAQRQTSVADGVVFVPLAAVVGREQMITAIADALGLVLYVATDRAEQLLLYLHEKTLLLVLDNFEHLLTDVPSVVLISTLLRGAPAIKLIITSREQLQLQAEWVFEVPGLPMPDSGDHWAAGTAVSLFLQCAQQARVGFTLTAADRPAVLRICQLVEGLPLGIELAAAWVRMLSCQEIAAEIQRSLDFLATSARDMPERHRSMRAVFDYSWHLLSGQEQRVLRQLAVFRGGFGREAAEYVANATLSWLALLVAKSLLQRTATGRYDLHELVRQYALSYLQEDEQEYIQTRNRHCQYFAALLARREPALKGTDRPTVVAELLTELANLRLSWHWAATHQQAEQVSQGADTLFWLYESRSNCREGVPLFGQVVQSFQVNERAATDTRIAWVQHLALAQALSYQGFFCFRQGQHPQGRELLQRSLVLLRPLSDIGGLPARTALATTLGFLGTVISMMGDYLEGRHFLQEGLMLKRALNDRWGAAFCLRQLGLLSYYLGEYAEAHHLLSESLVLSRAMGNTWSIASSLNLLSTVAYAQGAYDEAQQALQEGLLLSQALEDRYNIAMAFNGLGLVNQALGRPNEAQAFFQASITLWREIGDHGSLAQTLDHLGNMLLTQGARSEACHCLQEALVVAKQAQVIPLALNALLSFATLQAEETAIESALGVLMYILQHPASAQVTKARAEKLRVEIEAPLMPQQIAAIRAQVQSKTLDAFAEEILIGFAT